MRKQDIIVTTPEKSVIYAVGTSSEKSDKVWADVETKYWGDSRHYTPAYVLDLHEDGYAVVLLAKHYPGSTGAIKSKQAEPLDALDYTLADWQARKAVLEKFSHWPLSMEQRDLRDEELAELKELPENWQISTIRTTYVRMLWAEYQSRLEALIDQRSNAKLREEQAREDQKAARDEVIDKVASLVGLTERQAEDAKGRYYLESVELPTAAVKHLLELAEKGA